LSPPSAGEILGFIFGLNEALVKEAYDVTLENAKKWAKGLADVPYWKAEGLAYDTVMAARWAAWGLAGVGIALGADDIYQAYKDQGVQGLFKATAINFGSAGASIYVTGACMSALDLETLGLATAGCIGLGGLAGYDANKIGTALLGDPHVRGKLVGPLFPTVQPPGKQP
jgi:hypothetical protein